MRPAVLILPILVAWPGHGCPDLGVYGDFAAVGLREPRLVEASEATWPDTVYTVTETPGGAWTLDGHPLAKFEPPAGHARGVANDGLYRLDHPDGPRLLKIVARSDRFPAVHEESLRGTLLGAQAGTPAVHRYGRLRLPDGGTALFVEMELAFAGRPSFTYKGLVQTRRPDRFRPLADHGYRRKMAELLVGAYGRRLVPGSDVDFLFSEGNVRLLDTADWTYRPGAIDARTMASFGKLMTSLSYEPAAARAMLTDFLAVLKRSSLDGADKKAVLEHCGLKADDHPAMTKLRTAPHDFPPEWNGLSNGEFLDRLYAATTAAP